MNHTPEPWQHIWKHDTHKVKRDRAGRMLDSVTMNLDDYDRAMDCVNALAGIEDPAIMLQNAVSALREIENAALAIQFHKDDRPEFHARRIIQLVRAVIQSTNIPKYPWEMQEPALLPEQP